MFPLVRDLASPSALLRVPVTVTSRVLGFSAQAFYKWLKSTACQRDWDDAHLINVVALAGEALERCRQRVQQQILGHRGRSGDPLDGIRRRLRAGADLLSSRQLDRLDVVLSQDRHVAVALTWSVYQRVMAACRHPDRQRSKNVLTALIASLRRGVPDGLPELATLGRTLSRRAADVLAYFDRPGTSNGPSEAISGRLEHLRGTALGFRNLASYTTRALLDSGGPRMVMISRGAGGIDI